MSNDQPTGATLTTALVQLPNKESSARAAMPCVMDWTAETVIGALEDAEDYRAFEAAIIADHDAQSAVERELVLRLASLLWRIRRATTMETGLFDIQARHLLEYREKRDAQQQSIRRSFGSADDPDFACDSGGQAADHCPGDLTQCYFRLAR